MTPEGYSNIPHDTFLQWIANTYGHAYDLDGSFGAQCWDYASLFWRNVGFAAGYPLTGNGYAYGCWTIKREENASDTFWLITNKEDIKQGDILVFNATVDNVAGHITFAATNYNGTNYIDCIGQNQGGAAVIGGGSAVHIHNFALTNFLGAFRYKGWSESSRKKSKFPWVLYANKLRNKY